MMVLITGKCSFPGVAPVEVYRRDLFSCCDISRSNTTLTSSCNSPFIIDKEFCKLDKFRTIYWRMICQEIYDYNFAYIAIICSMANMNQHEKAVRGMMVYGLVFCRIRDSGKVFFKSR
jgi:hypothetical protein